MIQQPDLFSFHTDAPINIESITGQNRKLYEFLSAGNTVSMFDCPRIGVGYLNSRISDLRNKNGIHIYDRMINVNGTSCKEYSLTPFDTK